MHAGVALSPMEWNGLEASYHACPLQNGIESEIIERMPPQQGCCAYTYTQGHHHPSSALYSIQIHVQFLTPAFLTTFNFKIHIQIQFNSFRGEIDILFGGGVGQRPVDGRWVVGRCRCRRWAGGQPPGWGSAGGGTGVAGPAAGTAP
jgi:hypothetical protein